LTSQLSLLPPPYPDELLYSVFARYHIWSRNPSQIHTITDLFGTRSVSSVPYFSTHLNILSCRLPEGSLNSPEGLIDKNSFFPLFKLFLSHDRVNKIIDVMRGTEQSNTSILAGIVQCTVPQNTYLRYCPRCFLNDKELCGEPYWHRTHQVFGVRVCPIHKTTLLKDSRINILNPKNRQAHIALNDEHVDLTIAEGSIHDYNHYLAIAESVHWLLNNKLPSIELHQLKERYLYCLRDKGFVSYKGKVRNRTLSEAFIDYYTPAFLQHFNSLFEVNKKDTWIEHLYKKSGGIVHPIRHLLFMRFLGLTPESFFALEVEEYHPFGKGPWICFNGAADHYNETVVEKCEVSYRPSTAQPIGIFSCRCGFIYSKTGAGIPEEIGQVVEYGPLWEQRLLDLKKKEKRSNREIAEMLHVSKSTIGRHLKRIEEGSLVVSPKQVSVDIDKRSSYREHWIHIVKNHSDLSKSELSKMAKKEYAWLFKYDCDWLDEHSPEARYKYEPPVKFFNWQKRDEELAEEVLIAARTIKELTGKPTHVTVKSIGTVINQYPTIANHISKLPNTKKALGSVTETVEAFQIRRVKYIINYLRDRGEFLSEWKIVRKAGLKQVFTDEVRAVIQSEIEKQAE
jgi:transposase